MTITLLTELEIRLLDTFLILNDPFDSILLLGIPLDVIIILLLRFGSEGDFPASVLGILLDSRGPSFPDFFDRR